ncbi:MAG: adaptor protein MecA [Oscillospiraceae bacterium]|nr:adaptor protein MecA [Oscillospiraceae bacterium]
MQIDVLSQNTLKLTLSRLDMFDMDIRYESLSGKNPDTKRLLSHVLRTVKLDKNAGVDFSGERLFVEAFPRPDGGCMLYISGLNDEEKLEKADKPVRLTTVPRVKPSVKPVSSVQPPQPQLLCHLGNVSELEGLCKSLSWQRAQGRAEFTGTLYGAGGVYRLLISADNHKPLKAIAVEYGTLLDAERELAYTAEHFTLLAQDNAIEKMS